MKTSGIYKIVNKKDGKCYVGSSVDILSCDGRFYHHQRLLRLGEHHCVHLQRAYNRYGKKNFQYKIIKKVAAEQLLKEEQKYLDKARKHPSMYYNCSFDAGKITMTPETRAKIGAKSRAWLSDPKNHHMFGKKHKKSTIVKIREARKHQPPISEQGRKKIADFHRGRKWPERAKKIKGMGNPNADKTIYTFMNVNTEEKFSGYKYEFIKKYNLPRWYAPDLILHGKTKRGWKFLSIG